ncbi:MAG: arylamine N-acetyltransferase [Candidatus Krumholzibacteriota bacterium]|nr:arylamine N-acetyltransferase [Candidatus Krumholzibacteriota bacterium]
MSGEGLRVKELFFDHFSIGGKLEECDLLRLVITHFSKLPYENITKIITKFTRDDPDERLRGPEDVIRGYIDSNTGGTCFSLTWCLGSILSASGYRCYPVMADMKRTNIHCALVVHAAGKRYIVDPGYLLGEPVELGQSVVVKKTSFGTLELRPRGSESYDLFTVTGTEKKWRYRVRTTPVAQAQFLKYWKESFALPMMDSLQLTRLTENGHLYIKNHHLRLRRDDSRINENIRTSLESRIEREFGIPAGVTAQAREHIERMRKEWSTRKQENRKMGRL